MVEPINKESWFTRGAGGWQPLTCSTREVARHAITKPIIQKSSTAGIGASAGSKCVPDGTSEAVSDRVAGETVQGTIIAHTGTLPSVFSAGGNAGTSILVDPVASRTSGAAARVACAVRAIQVAVVALVVDPGVVVAVAAQSVRVTGVCEGHWWS